VRSFRRPAAWCAIVLALASVALPDRYLGAALAQVAPSAATMDVSEVRPGMRGYGLTVMRGTTPERFEVEVVDVLHHFRPDQPLILIRTEHPVFADASTVGGMSGSPIYLEDRLVGAYAYGWSFGRQPIAGVTPIRNMLAELDRAPRPDSFPGAAPVGSPAAAPRARARRAQLQGEPYVGQPRSIWASLPGAPRVGSEPSLVPCSTPLLVGGLEPSAVSMLQQQLAPYGLDVLQAGGHSDEAPNTHARFVDGGAIAVTLARGDIDMTAVGTVTHVRGQRLVAFGHPFLEAGETGLPTAVARVAHILASYQRSFKMAEATSPVGAMIQDRQAAIVIDQSMVPATIPVRLRLSGVAAGAKTEWNFELASHRALTPALLGSAVQSAVKSVASDVTHVMFEATSRVWLEGRTTPVELTDRGYSAAGVATDTALAQLRGYEAVIASYANPFEDTRPVRVEIDLALRFERAVVDIVDASVESTQVDPGSRVRIRVLTRGYAEPERASLVDVDIPESAAGQNLTIFLQPGNEVEVERAEPRSLEDVLTNIRERYTANQLVVSTRMPSRGVRMAGHVVSSVPASVLDALQTTSDADRARPFVTHRRIAIPMPSVLTGGARVELEVRRVARSPELRGPAHP
jgi:SpoIVB peptidase S55